MTRLDRDGVQDSIFALVPEQKPLKRRKRNLKRSRPASDRLSIYDGRLRLGAIQDVAKGVRAFDSAGAVIGIFPTRLEAARAIGRRTDG